MSTPDDFSAIHEGVMLHGKRTPFDRKLSDILFLNGGAALGALFEYVPNVDEQRTWEKRLSKKRDITSIMPKHPIFNGVSMYAKYNLSLFILSSYDPNCGCSLGCWREASNRALAVSKHRYALGLSR